MLRIGSSGAKGHWKATWVRDFPDLLGSCYAIHSTNILTIPNGVSPLLLSLVQRGRVKHRCAEMWRRYSLESRGFPLHVSPECVVTSNRRNRQEEHDDECHKIVAHVFGPCPQGFVQPKCRNSLCWSDGERRLETSCCERKFSAECLGGVIRPSCLRASSPWVGGNLSWQLIYYASITRIHSRIAERM